MKDTIMRCLGDEMFTLVVDTPLTNRNDGQGHHWGRTNRDRKKAQKLIEECVVRVDHPTEEGTAIDTPFKDILGNVQLSEPVTLIVTRVLGPNQRLVDQDSLLRGNCKQLIDAIVASGLLADDKPKHVALVVGVQDDSRREQGPCTEITFLAVENV